MADRKQRSWLKFKKCVKPIAFQFIFICQIHSFLIYVSLLCTFSLCFVLIVRNKLKMINTNVEISLMPIKHHQV